MSNNALLDPTLPPASSNRDYGCTLGIMFTGLRSTALTVVALVIASWAVILLAGVGTESIVAVGATAMLALAALAVLSTTRPVVVVVGDTGPPESASRRRRGAFQRQSNPSTPGRPRPRAPGVAALV